MTKIKSIELVSHANTRAQRDINHYRGVRQWYATIPSEPNRVNEIVRGATREADGAQLPGISVGAFVVGTVGISLIAAVAFVLLYFGLFDFLVAK